MESKRLPATPDGAIQRSACQEQYLDGDLDAFAQWHTPGPAGEPGETNVVELTIDVSARPQRAAHS